MIVHYSSLFQFFLSSPCSGWKFLIFIYYFTVLQIIIIIWWTHIYHIIIMIRTPVVLKIVWRWSINYAFLSLMFKPLRSKTNQGLYEKHLCIKSRKYEWSSVPQLRCCTHNYSLKSEISVVLLCLLFSTH